MITSASVYRLLSAVCRGYRGKGYKVSDGLRALAAKLPGAVVLGDRDLPLDVVTLGSILHLTELSTGMEFDCRIVLPSQADPSKRWISLFSLIGAAVFGEREGAVVTYRTLERFRLITIDRVAQPEEKSSQSTTVPAAGSKALRP
jgi:transcription elongation GreA/GreB family factor